MGGWVGQVFYPYVLGYIVAYFFQGGSGGSAMGLLSNIRSYLWIPITQNAYRCVAAIVQLSTE